MAIVILIVGVIVFGAGVAGQVIVSRRFSKDVAPGDRKGYQLVLTLGGIILGAWIIIAGVAAMLHSHANTQQHTQNPS